MDEQKLKVILEAEIDDAIGYVETETVEQRTKAINYYNRYEYGNEVDGRSKIVTRSVRAKDARRRGVRQASYRTYELCVL